MGWHSACSCISRFLGRYTKSVADTPQHSTLSRQAQALEFCNVCVTEVAANDAAPSTNPAEWSLQGYLSHPFFKDLFLLAVGCPFIFFGCLTPLWFRDGAIFEIWRGYFWFWMSFASCWFGRNLMVMSWGRGPRLRTVFISAVVISICGTAIAVVSCKTSMVSFAFDTGTVFVQLYLPALHIWRVRYDAHYDTINFVWYLTGISAGAVPCGISAFLYYYVSVSPASEHIDTFLCLALWLGSSVMMKSIGKQIWTHAAPTCKVFGPIMWVFYVEVTMNCLGIRIFFSSFWSALLFSTSFLMTAAMQLYRGTEKYHGAKPASETIGVHRLTLFMETFASCVGRLTALTMYVCFTALQLACGKQEEDIRRAMPSMFGGQIVTLNSIDVYRNSNVDTSKPWVGAVGVFEILVVFAWFTVQASRWWKAGSAISAKVAPVQPDEYELPPAPSRSRSVGAAAGHRPGRWWDELYLGETKIHQLDLLSAFVAQYWDHLLSSVIFSFALGTLLVSTADRSRFGLSGMPDC